MAHVLSTVMPDDVVDKVLSTDAPFEDDEQEFLCKVRGKRVNRLATAMCLFRQTNCKPCHHGHSHANHPVDSSGSLLNVLSFLVWHSQDIYENHLTEEEQEDTAQSSYAYWVWTTTKQNDASTETSMFRQRSALKEIRRHLLGAAGSTEKAVQSLRSRLEQMQPWNLSILRACFVAGFPFASQDDKELAESYRRLIREDLSQQTVVVRGRDMDGRPIVLVQERTVPPTDTKGFLLTRLYILERALAAAECLSNEKVVTVADYGNYQSSNSPSITVIKEAVVLLQSCYPERLKRLIMLDPPFWARTAYNAVYPFLMEETRQKFMLVSGDVSEPMITRWMGEFMDSVSVCLCVCVRERERERDASYC